MFSLMRSVRRTLISGPLLSLVRRLKLLPAISDTERAALDAGGTWIEADLFSGRLDFKKIMAENYPDLSQEEKDFLAGPVERLCLATDDWKSHRTGDLAPEVWRILREEGFFGLNIPRSYGGRGFSARGYSQVVMTLASRSASLSITAMVPNSLGPAELLVHYGTEEQKSRLLPRLARGEEIPCFALTEPEAGSDAGSIRSEGVVFRDGAGELKLRLNWDKRYITLGSVATLIGLAIKLRDPENLLGLGESPGITCVLVDAAVPGIWRGRRHDPLGVPFINSPLSGTDVIVPVSAIIGGPAGAGKGWMMLMECLAAGRGLSLPASMAGGVKHAARVVSLYATVRRQFGVSIGRFEGIMEKMAVVGGLAYLLEALRVFTCGSVDSGKKSSVVSAIAKYSATEISRRAVTAAMDIVGGAGISLGPRNLLGHHYLAAPIGITVEGANVLTRSMIVFGNGAFRCHPYIYREMKAVLAGDVAAFDVAFWGHVRLVLGNFLRAVTFSLSRGHLASGVHESRLAQYRRRLVRASATFSFLADLSIGLFAGSLKRREYLTGYFADMHAWMYIATCLLRRFQAEGERRESEAVARWALEYSFMEIRAAFEGVVRNMRVPIIGHLLRGVVLPWSRLNPVGSVPGENLTTAVARGMQDANGLRELLFGDLFQPGDPTEALVRLQRADHLGRKAEPVLERVREAAARKRIRRASLAAMLSEAETLGVVTAEERAWVGEASEAAAAAVAVDEFSEADFGARQVACDSRAKPLRAAG